MVVELRIAVYTLTTIAGVAQPHSGIMAASKDDNESGRKSSSKHVPKACCEKVQWQQQLRGIVGPTDKEIADDMAIGGLRNTAASVSRLTYFVSFGLKL